MNHDVRLVISLLEPSFPDSSSKNLGLTAYFHDRFISLLIKDRDRDIYVGYERYESDNTLAESGKERLFPAVSNLFGQKHLAPEIFSTVMVVCESLHYTLIPGNISTRETAKQLLRFNHKVGYGFSSLQNTIALGQIADVFTIPRSLYDIIVRTFNFPVIHHHAAVLAEAGLFHARSGQLENPVYFNSGSSGADILVVREGNIHYLNSFRCQSNEDKVYYLLFVLDQLKINPEINPVFLSGVPDTDNQLYLLLSRYVRDIGMLTRSTSSAFRDFFNQIPSSVEIPLFNAELCE
jgi:hypothetical protein